jgi:sugar lactone lactonase YvrE
VLGYKDVTAFVNGGAADLVIGQPDFLSSSCNLGGANPSASSLCTPFGLAVDLSGNLYVADQGNNRVLEYDSPFSGCGSFPCVGGAANKVFGQAGSFTSSTSNNGGLTANSLSSPSGVAVDTVGNLYVADLSNSRVLEYNTPLTTDTTADRVFGQSGFTSGACNLGAASPSAVSLCLPVGVAMDSSGALYVADTSNSRVLVYKTPLISATANIVLGQADFASGDFNQGLGVSATSMADPDGVAVDAAGNLYVADTRNSRALEFNPPLTNDETPHLVFGQGNSFTSNSCDYDALSGAADSLCLASGIAVDGVGNLYVADTQNNRVLEYDKPVFSPTPTATATATATPTPTATATATATPTATATATATATVTATPTTTSTPTTTATATQTATLTATAAATPTATSTATATATASAISTATPTATPTSSSTEGAEQLVVNPSKLNFGTVGIGTTSASQTATITSEFNDDTVDFFASFITANFVETGSTCGSSLGPVQSCQINFACRPRTTGATIGAYAFLYGSWETSVLDTDDVRKIGVVQFTCTGA